MIPQYASHVTSFELFSGVSSSREVLDVVLSVDGVLDVDHLHDAVFSGLFSF